MRDDKLSPPSPSEQLVQEAIVQIRAKTNDMTREGFLCGFCRCLLPSHNGGCPMGILESAALAAQPKAPIPTCHACGSDCGLCGVPDGDQHDADCPYREVTYDFAGPGEPKAVEPEPSVGTLDEPWESLASDIAIKFNLSKQSVRIVVQSHIPQGFGKVEILLRAYDHWLDNSTASGIVWQALEALYQATYAPQEEGPHNGT